MLAGRSLNPAAAACPPWPIRCRSHAFSARCSGKSGIDRPEPTAMSSSVRVAMTSAGRP